MPQILPMLQMLQVGEFVIRPFWDVADTLNDATGCAAAKAQSWIAAQTGAARLEQLQLTTAIAHDDLPQRFYCVVTVSAWLYGVEQMTPEDHARAEAYGAMRQQAGIA